MVHVMNQNRAAIFSLAAAGVLWGLSVPLSKLSLAWLTPGWLTAIRFAAAAPLLAFAGRRGLREAMTPWIAISGAIGFGAVIMLQNAGIEHTSVSHAAVLVGAVPLLVALIAAGLGQSSTKPLTWAGYGLAFAGIALVAGHAGSGATGPGDVLVLGSAALSAAFIAVQPRMLAGRDATAVTAVQFAAGALVALPIAALTEGAPHTPAHAGSVLAVAALSVTGSLAFPLFAFGQACVPAELAGTFVNLEPVVGVAVGWIAFGDSAAIGQLFGAAAVLLGIALSTVPTDDWARWTAGWQIRLPNGLRALTSQRSQ